MIQFSTEVQNGILLLSISGSLDAITYETATEYFDSLIAEGHSKFVVNVLDLEYVSSAGIRVLLGAIKSSRSAGGDLRLAHVGGQVFDTLEIAGIISIVKYYDGIDTAIASYSD